MLLCIDCGNTRLKWGMYGNLPGSNSSGRQWLAQGALVLAEVGRLPEEIQALPRPTRIIACNVAGATTRAGIDACAAVIGSPLVWNESHAEQCGVHNGYEDPAQLGADRWAALIGAHHAHAGACLVVNAGTATTADVLDAAGIFQGGIILPGVDLMRTALAHNTARLPLAAGDFQPLPRNTRSAIASGCLQATAGAVGRMFAPLAAQEDAICLLSGGAADSFAALLDIPLRRIDNLVLEGLARIADEADPD